MDNYINDYFALTAGMVSAYADTSDFGDDEIRCLNPKTPVHIKDIDHWDRVLVAKIPIEGDLGINKSKDIFLYSNDKWLRVNNN